MFEIYVINFNLNLILFGLVFDDKYFILFYLKKDGKFRV